MRLRCPFCLTPVRFDHRHLVDRTGFVECGECHARYQVSIDASYEDADLEDLAFVDDELRVFDIDGVLIRRVSLEEKPATKEVSSSTSESLVVRIPPRLKAFYSFVALLVVAVLVTAGLFVVREKGPPTPTEPPINTTDSLPEKAIATAQPAAPAPKELLPEKVVGSGNDVDSLKEGVVAPQELGLKEDHGESPKEELPAVAQDEEKGEEPEPGEEKPDEEKKGKVAKKGGKKRGGRAKIAARAGKNSASMSVNELIMEANKLESSGNRKGAEALYEKVIAKDRNNLSANFHLGKIYFNSGRKSLALVRFRTVMRNGGFNRGEATILAARCEISLGHDLSAKELYRKYLSRYGSGRYAGEAKSYLGE